MRGAAAWQLDLRPGDADSSGTLFISLGGRWRIDQGLPAPETLNDSLDASVRRVRFEAEQLADWDSGLLSFVAGIGRSCTERGIAIDDSGLPPGARRLLAMAAAVPEQRLAGRPVGPQDPFAQVGEATLEFFRGAPQMLAFLGEVVMSLLRLISGRARFRTRDLWLEIEEVGPRALPIVSVISFLVGLILAYLGADQLMLVGAQIFIADLVAIGMVREVGALMTGIIIAGRTGAAFAAQLGTMQVNEEIDAYNVLGISAIDFLVLPRILALMLMVPLLTLYSGFIGMLAGLLVSVTIFDIGVFEYYTETLRALEFKQFAVGLSKGTVYGAMIAFAGCLRGMQCGRSAEAVGHAATSAVVTAILLITIAASIMTIVYYQLGI
ncbi:MAG: ABC transporter permease [Betaproteobacteria bacterium]|nr:ABC transporter permease [Betaproteobacteria bacterium]